jgi:hypothetical protein
MLLNGLDRSEVVINNINKTEHKEKIKPLERVKV